MIVVATSYNNPLSCLNSIAKSLHAKKFKGKVIFDLLCSNGLESNRFMSVFFDGSNFNHTSFKVEFEGSFPSEIVEIQNIYFANHRWILDNSVLSTNEILQFQ
ncbi:type II toxin-antitoxin system RnlB family antitoxin [Phytobacter sp. RSE-02]|uniref:type II toxin-antitoxin system RnlB family antitoxin n=1 Tax=Phytobacter sp. RSE-02 TaxID=3229229 RepID=UPI00339D34EC